MGVTSHVQIYLVVVDPCSAPYVRTYNTIHTNMVGTYMCRRMFVLRDSGKATPERRSLRTTNRGNERNEEVANFEPKWRRQPRREAAMSTTGAQTPGFDEWWLTGPSRQWSAACDSDEALFRKEGRHRHSTQTLGADSQTARSGLFVSPSGLCAIAIVSVPWLAPPRQWCCLRVSSRLHTYTHTQWPTLPRQLCVPMTVAAVLCGERLLNKGERGAHSMSCDWGPRAGDRRWRDISQRGAFMHKRYICTSKRACLPTANPWRTRPAPGTCWRRCQDQDSASWWRSSR